MNFQTQMRLFRAACHFSGRLGYIDSLPRMIESDCFGTPFMYCTLPCQIATMRPPLPTRGYVYRSRGPHTVGHRA